MLPQRAHVGVVVCQCTTCDSGVQSRLSQEHFPEAALAAAQAVAASSAVCLSQAPPPLLLGHGQKQSALWTNSVSLLCAANFTTLYWASIEFYFRS